MASPELVEWAEHLRTEVEENNMSEDCPVEKKVHHHKPPTFVQTEHLHIIERLQVESHHLVLLVFFLQEVLRQPSNTTEGKWYTVNSTMSFCCMPADQTWYVI